MISQTQIARLVENREHRQLLHRILLNGRCRSAAVMNALMQPHALAPAALGLALQRVSEITYRPCPIANSIAGRLIHLQRDDGSFSSESEDGAGLSLAATAVAIRGLTTYRSLCASFGLPTSPRLEAGIAKGISHLSQSLSQQDVEAPTTQLAIVLWQLGDDADFRAQIDVSHLLQLLDESESDLLHDDLCRYAHAMAA